MSEPKKKDTTVEEENVETEKEATTAKKKTAEKKSDKKDKQNWLKRTGKKVRDGMSNHPFWTAFGGAAVGSAATVGIGYGGKKLLQKRRERNNQCAPQFEDNSLDPNV